MTFSFDWIFRQYWKWLCSCCKYHSEQYPCYQKVCGHSSKQDYDFFPKLCRHKAIWGIEFFWVTWIFSFQTTKSSQRNCICCIFSSFFIFSKFTNFWRDSDTKFQYFYSWFPCCCEMSKFVKNNQYHKHQNSCNNSNSNHILFFE